MREKNYPPIYRKEEFHCPRCNVFAKQIWSLTLKATGNRPTPLEISCCVHCKEDSYWFRERLIEPAEASVPPPHPDLPENCKPDYEEARDILARSPKSAAALLRLCIQKLMPHLGESGENINNDIKSLVEKGLPSLVQQALDYCRVVGNNAVHPGLIDLNDTPEMAHQIFEMINFIVNDRITRPKEIQELYDQLPEGAREAIRRRNGRDQNQD